MSGVINKAKEAVEKIVHKDKRSDEPGTGSAGTGGVDTTYDNPQSTTQGPHSSNLGNKADPRVDSDMDNSRTMGAGAGASSIGGTGAGTDTAGYGGSGLTGGSSGATGYGQGSGLTGGSSDTTGYGQDSGLTGGTSGTSGYGQGSGLTGGSGDTAGYGTQGSGLGGGDTGYGARDSGLTGGTSGAAGYGTQDSGLTGTGDASGYGTRDSGLTGGTSGNAGYGGQGSGLTGGSTGYGSRDTAGDFGTGGTTTGGYGAGDSTTGGYDGSGPGPASGTAGPHKSDMLNKMDPRVDSNLDGSRTVGGDKTYDTAATKAMSQLDIGTGTSPPDAAAHPPSKFKSKLSDDALPEPSDHGRRHSKLDAKTMAELYGPGHK